MLKTRLVWIAGFLFLVHGLLLVTMGTRFPGPLLSNSLELLLGGIGVYAAYLACRRSGPFGRLAWAFVSCSLVIWTVAQGIITYYESVLHASYEIPWPSDPLIFFWVVPLFMALFLATSSGRKRFDPIQSLDFVQIMILAAAAYVAYLYAPSQWRAAGEWMSRLGWDATNVRDAILSVGLIARSRFSRTKLVRSLFLRLTGFFVLYQIGDLVYHYGEEAWKTNTGSPWDLLWSAPFVAVIVGAATWQRHDESELAQISIRRDTVRRGLFLTSAFLPLPVLYVALKVEKEVPKLGVTLVVASLLVSASRLLLTQARRDRSKAELEESEERFRRLSDASFEGVAFSDTGGKIILANTRLAEMLGCEMRDLVGSTVGTWVAPESMEVVMDHRRTRSEAPFEHFLRRKDGSIVAVESRARHLSWAGNTIRVTAIRDVSERKRAEQVLRGLTEGTASVTGADFFSSLVRHSAAALHVKYAFVAECHLPGKARTLAYWDGTGVTANFEYDLKGTPCEDVLSGKVCVHRMNLRAQFPNDQGLARMEVESYIGVPMFDSGRKVIGHLAVLDTRPMPRDPQLISILEIFAARAGAELERQRALEALQAEKAFTEALIDSLPGLVYVINAKGEVIRWNKNAGTILGYSQQELAALNTLDVIAEEDREKVAAKWLEAFAQGHAVSEACVLIKDGRKVPFLLSAVRAEFGNAVFVIGTGIDITERKRAEESLRESEERFRQMAENSPDMFWLYDLRAEKLLYISPAFERIWGRKVEELHASPRLWRETIHPDDRDYITHDFDTRAKTVGSENEHRIIWPDGTSRWIHGRVFPIRDAAGETCRLAGIVYDVTDRRHAEEALRRQEKLFHAVVEDQTEMIVRWKPDGTRTFVNEAYRRTFAPTQGELIGTSFFRYLAREDRERIQQKIASLTPDNPTATDTHPSVLSDGSLAWHEWTDRALFDGEGRMTEMQSVGRDITERKKAEEAMKISEARYRTLIETAPDAIVVFDPATRRFVDFNENACHLFGLSGQELRSVGPVQVSPPCQPDGRPSHEAANQYVQEAMAGQVPVFEWTHRNAVGSEIPCEVRLVRLPAAGKMLIRGSVTDITERKRAEAALKQSEASLAEAQRIGRMGSWEWNVLSDEERWSDELYRLYGVKRTDQVMTGDLFLKLVHPEDRERLRLSGQKAIKEGQPVQEAFRLVRADGEVRDMQTRAEIARDSLGAPVRLVGTTQDITERRLAEEALKQSEAGLAEAQRVARMGSWEWDIATGEERWSDEMFRLVGIVPGSVRPSLEMFLNSVHPDDREKLVQAGEKAQKDQQTFQFEYRAFRTDGATRIFHSRAEIIRDSKGKAVRMVGATQDVTEQKQAEEALRASQEMFYRAFHSSPEPVCIITLADDNFLDVNKAFCDAVGYGREEVIGKTAVELGLAPLSGLTSDQLQLLERGGLHNVELELRTRSGDLRTALVSFEIVEITGQPCILAQGRDVTEHRRAENALRASDQRYRDFISHSTEGVWRLEFEKPVAIDLPIDEQIHEMYRSAYLAECNDAMARMIGASSAETLIGHYLKDLISGDDEGRIETYRSAAIGRWLNRTVQFQGLDLQGRPRHLERTEIPIVEDGLLKRVWGMTRDVTALHDAEEALRASEQRYRLLFERNLAGVLKTTLDGRLLECNDAFARIQGYTSREEILTASVRDFYLERADGTSLMDLLKRQPLIMGQEFHTRRKDGSAAWMLVSASLIEDESTGSSILATAFDITHWKELGEQLRQSQKMEAVGRLAGGVAHDFNNMLQIINGYSELVIDQLPGQDPLRSHVYEIKNIVERAAGLTRQLLAFSRQQVLAPQVLDLNIAISNLSKMLRRLIGEDVELIMTEGHPLGRVKADPGQIDQVILNLAVNARDAMPRGGKLTIETANLDVDGSYALAHFPMTPGPFVMVSVTDTGHGMDAETQARIFEPFFTTKEKGKGTGLGLATVYGIVKQSGGYIWAESEAGKGTTFKVFLPPAVDSPVQQEAAATPASMQGSETVLLVEDEEYVRSLVRRSLQSKGYAVLEARDGKDAMGVSNRHHGPIHLLITDVVMPGMSGRELAESLTPRRREMKTLFMSGYTDDAILHHGVLDSGTALLQKPFTAEALAAKVRQVLERS